jgi:hypothetical protein
MESQQKEAETLFHDPEEEIYTYTYMCVYIY